MRGNFSRCSSRTGARTLRACRVCVPCLPRVCHVHRFSLQRATGLALQHERTHFGGAATYGYFAAVRSDTSVYTPLTPALPALAVRIENAPEEEMEP